MRAAGDATRLSEWASTLKLPSDQTCFFNFMASHDGIGVRPVEGILSRDELNVLVKRVQAHGGKVRSAHVTVVGAVSTFLNHAKHAAVGAHACSHSAWGAVLSHTLRITR